MTRPDPLQGHRKPDRAAELVAWLQVRTSCPHCGKRCYASRKAAKKAAVLLHPGIHMLRYRCGDFWHLSRMKGQSKRPRSRPRRRDAAMRPPSVTAEAA